MDVDVDVIAYAHADVDVDGVVRVSGYVGVC